MPVSIVCSLDEGTPSTSGKSAPFTPFSGSCSSVWVFGGFCVSVDSVGTGRLIVRYPGHHFFGLAMFGTPWNGAMSVVPAVTATLDVEMRAFVNGAARVFDNGVELDTEASRTEGEDVSPKVFEMSSGVGSVDEKDIWFVWGMDTK